jgi:hypothetical protein
MAWFAVVVDADGTLVSVGTVVADPLPLGLVAIDFGADRPDQGDVRWNPAKRTFDPFTPEPEPPDPLTTLVEALTKIATLDDVKAAAVATKEIIDTKPAVDAEIGALDVIV